MAARSELRQLVVADAAAWRAWLAANAATSAGVVLVLAKKGTTDPTSLTYDEALEEALCFGWIDGRVQARDDATYTHQFSPRRSGSMWSRRNVAIAERLISTGRMTAAGHAEIERAKADGRWERAYAGPATAEPPPELLAALAAEPVAQRWWDVLTKQNKYAILFRIQAAKRPETRARRIEQFVGMLARGETPYPQKRRPDDAA